MLFHLFHFIDTFSVLLLGSTEGKRGSNNVIHLIIQDNKKQKKQKKTLTVMPCIRQHNVIC